MRVLQLLVLLAGLSVLASCGDEQSSGGGDGSGTAAAAKTGKPERTPETIAAGKEVFKAQCEKCHGPEGKGDGISKGVALPQPADFTQRRFKYVSTENRVPSENDLFRTVSDGIAGTQMAGFKDTVREPDRWAAVYYLQELAKFENPPKPYAVPARPAYGDNEKRQAGRIFLSSCVKCHGVQGQGDGVAADTLKDGMGNPIKPRSLADQPFGGGMEPEQVFCRIKLGMNGSPMEPPESYPRVEDKDAWALVEYVLNLRTKK